MEALKRELEKRMQEKAAGKKLTGELTPSASTTDAAGALEMPALEIGVGAGGDDGNLEDETEAFFQNNSSSASGGSALGEQVAEEVVKRALPQERASKHTS